MTEVRRAHCLACRWLAGIFQLQVSLGESDEIFEEIAADLEVGSARRLYRVVKRPDVSHTPIPRFDLLALKKYTFMAVQFSRGCPFTCEFCNIITLYGRRPRTKSPRQLIGELDALVQFGWRKDIFIVDDKFHWKSQGGLWSLRGSWNSGSAATGISSCS